MTDAGRPRGTALVLPGHSYDVTRPLLARVVTALEAAGWEVRSASWSLDGPVADPPAFAAAAASRLLEGVAHGPMLVVGKSLGAFAAGWAAQQRLPGAWLTPVLRSGGSRPAEPAVVAGLRRTLASYPARSIVVGGTADPFWERGLRAAGEVVELHGADHLLEGPDDGATERHHAAAVVAVAGLAARL